MKKLLTFTLMAVLLSGCKYETPPEMVVGKWQIVKITENGHENTAQFVNKYNKFIIFSEDGTYTRGVLDSLSNKSWMLYSEKNELLLLNGSPVQGVKQWKIKASDNQLELTDKHGHFKILLNRIENLPEISIRTEKDLIGKWIVDKVTINGYNNTKEYAFPERWILLSKNGKFYNGGKDNNQNTGYWQLDENLTAINFFNNKETAETFISFYIDDDRIWYEKKDDDRNKPSVRIYFKKEM
ncbi:hypothetical protein [Marivirga lumbricoides]